MHAVVFSPQKRGDTVQHNSTSFPRPHLHGAKNVRLWTISNESPRTGAQKRVNFQLMKEKQAPDEPTKILLITLCLAIKLSFQKRCFLSLSVFLSLSFSYFILLFPLSVQPAIPPRKPPRRNVSSSPIRTSFSGAGAGGGSSATENIAASKGAESCQVWWNKHCQNDGMGKSLILTAGNFLKIANGGIAKRQRNDDPFTLFPNNFIYV